MSDTTRTAGTDTEALARSIAELQQLVANVDPATNLGLALVTIKGNLQRIERGVAVDRDQWLLVADALKRVESSNIGGARQ